MFIVIKFNTHPHFEKQKKKPLIRRPVDDKTERPNFIVLNIKMFVFLHSQAHLNSTSTFMFPSNPIGCSLKSAHHHFGSHYHKSRSIMAFGWFSEFKAMQLLFIYNGKFFVRFNQTESG